MQSLPLLPLAAFAQSDGTLPVWKVALFFLLALFLLAFLVVFLRYANLYVRSVLTKAGVGLFDMVAMSLRRVSPTIIVNARVSIVQARIADIDKRDLEAHFLAGGNIERVVRALIAADRAGIPLDFRCGQARSPS